MNRAGRTERGKRRRKRRSFPDTVCRGFFFFSLLIFNFYLELLEKKKKKKKTRKTEGRAAVPSHAGSDDHDGSCRYETDVNNHKG